MKYLTVVLLIFTVTNLSTCKNNHPLISAPLQKITWQVHLMDNAPLLKGSKATLSFHKNTVHGNAGCNSYSGKITINKNKIQIKDLMRTSKACFQPKGILQQESKFISLLSKVSIMNISKKELILTTPTNQTILFMPVRPVVDKPLSNTHWQLQTIVKENLASSTVRGPKLFIRFLTSNLLNGYTGCNDFSATYTIQNNFINFNNFKINKQLCPNKSLQSQEKIFIRILTNTRQFLITENRLRLTTDSLLPLTTGANDFLEFSAQ